MIVWNAWEGDRREWRWDGTWQGVTIVAAVEHMDILSTFPTKIPHRPLTVIELVQTWVDLVDKHRLAPEKGNKCEEAFKNQISPTEFNAHYAGTATSPSREISRIGIPLTKRKWILWSWSDSPWTDGRAVATKIRACSVVAPPFPDELRTVPSSEAFQQGLRWHFESEWDFGTMSCFYPCSIWFYYAFNSAVLLFLFLPIILGTWFY